MIARERFWREIVNICGKWIELLPTIGFCHRVSSI
jgi:hypothetical protein